MMHIYNSFMKTFTIIKSKIKRLEERIKEYQMFKNLKTLKIIFTFKMLYNKNRKNFKNKKNNQPLIMLLKDLIKKATNIKD
jgi:hypothetical protein